MQEDNYVTVYHGTTASNAARIGREGIIPGAADGADKWASVHRPDIIRAVKRRHPSVFVTFEKYQASGFASYAAEVNNDKPAVLELKIPLADFQKQFRRDNASKGPDYRSLRAVPAAWVVGKRRLTMFNDRDRLNPDYIP